MRREKSMHNKKRAMKTQGSNLALCGVLMVGALAGCNEQQVILPASLQGPVSMAVAHGEVCLRLETISDEGLLGARIDACRAPGADAELGPHVRERGMIGLVTNMNEDRLAVVALDLEVPALVDLDLATPGVTHITVGQRPMKAGASPDGTVAYTMNQLDQDVSVVDLWAMRALPEPLKLTGTPIDMAVQPRSGLLVVGVVSPESRLQVHPGVRCEAPGVLPADVGASQSSCEGQDAAWQDMPLEGMLKSLTVDPVTDHAYLIYADMPWLSVVALNDEALGDESCLEGNSLPCEVARIGLTYSCSDGLDNDGDGRIDQDDAQCFGPFGAEGAGAIGISVSGACSDGEDGDGDGLIDRDDPDCRVASQSSEDAMLAPVFDEVTPECGDGVDNDGDGLTDVLDPDCYGVQGQREEAVASPSFAGVSVDEHGVLGYVIHPLLNEVLVIDIEGRRLLQPSAIAGTTNPRAERLGIRLNRTVAPTAVEGSIRRTVRRDPRAEYAASHGVIDYDLGAYVTGDNGFVYYVDAATVACDVWETQGLLDEPTFFLEPEVLSGRQESRCLQVPSEFLSDRLDVAPSCEEFLLCRECVRGGGTLESCALCSRYVDNDEFDRVDSVCALDERIEREGLLTRVFNPRFVVRDANEQDAGNTSTAQCVQPEPLINAVNQFIANNPSDTQVAGCGSPLVQQPLSVTVPTRGNQAPVDFVTQQRLDVTEQRSIRLLMDEQGEVSTQLVIDTEDFVVRDEDWTVAFEGILPGTRRGDGLLTDMPGVLDIGSLDPCVADVRVGDVLVIRSEPGSQTGGVPSGCESFETPESFSGSAWREYEVLEVYEDRLVFGVKEGAGTSSRLPTQECFARGIDYEVRAASSWLVTGSVSGIASGKVARDGVCVSGEGGDAPRVQSRVLGGERFVGPGISFWMTPGVVAPVRDASYLINVTRNFAASSTPGQLSINAATPRPTEIRYDYLYSAVPEGGKWPSSPTRKRLISVVEPADNTVVVREPIGGENRSVALR